MLARFMALAASQLLLAAPALAGPLTNVKPSAQGGYAPTQAILSESKGDAWDPLTDTIKTQATNPQCPNAAGQGAPGPGNVGQSYGAPPVVCPSPGGSTSATILGQDGVNPVSATNPLPSIDKNSAASLTAAQSTASSLGSVQTAQGQTTAAVTALAKQPIVYLLNATASAGSPLTSASVALAGGLYTSSCKATAWNGASVVQYYLAPDLATWTPTGWSCSADGPMVYTPTSGGPYAGDMKFGANTQIHEVLTASTNAPLNVSSGMGAFQ